MGASNARAHLPVPLATVHQLETWAFSATEAQWETCWIGDDRPGGERSLDAREPSWLRRRDDAESKIAHETTDALTLYGHARTPSGLQVRGGTLKELL
jgi:hypothetical protein